MLKFILFISLVFYIPVVAEAQDKVKASLQNHVPGETLSAKFFELYNAKKYAEAQSYLENNAGAKDKYVDWYYFEGLALARQDKYAEAIANFESYINKGESSAQKTKAYYYLGLMYFYSGSYELAINSFEVASDYSRDANLDKVLDSQLERAINYRDYFDSQKAFNLGIILGYYYSSNAIGLSQALSAQNLEGNVFNYGLTAAYKVVDKFNLVVEPNMIVYDRYTMDRKFKSVSTLQSTDALLMQFSLPVSFFFGRDGSVQYNFSINTANTYLPISTTKRELYLNSTFVKGKVKADLGKTWGLESSLSAASDKSSNFLSDSLNPTGSHFDFSLAMVQYLDKLRTQNVQYQLTATSKSATGADARYSRAELDFTYNFVGFGDMNSSVLFGIGQLKYPNMQTPRTDGQTLLSYSVAQSFDKGSGINYYVGYTRNTSNLDSYTYNEIKLGAMYNVNFGF